MHPTGCLKTGIRPFTGSAPLRAPPLCGFRPFAGSAPLRVPPLYGLRPLRGFSPLAGSAPSRVPRLRGFRPLAGSAPLRGPALGGAGNLCNTISRTARELFFCESWQCRRGQHIRVSEQRPSAVWPPESLPPDFHPKPTPLRADPARVPRPQSRKSEKGKMRVGSLGWIWALGNSAHFSDTQAVPPVILARLLSWETKLGAPVQRWGMR